MDDWYKNSFGPDYLIVYRHRDAQGAFAEVRQMLDWLALPPGARILDLCCGTGRHALALAELGYDVTGVDLSDTLLSEARKADHGKRVRWIQGDMRNVPLQQPFDVVVNLFTSFGYFRSDRDNQRVLAEIARLLKPDGLFVIDFLNPGFLRANLIPRSQKQSDGLTIYEKRSIQDGFIVKHIEIHDPGNEKKPVRKYVERVKLYDDASFRNLARQAGLKVTNLYGNYDRSPFDPVSSPRQIWVGTKLSPFSG